MIMPDRILCSKSHEWVFEEENNIFVGITDYIVEQLGEIVFVELPEVGLSFSKDEVFATVKSVKSVMEFYMPINGKIVEINETLINSPELLNENSYNSWFVKVEADDFQKDSQGLLEYSDYIDEV